MSRAAASVAPPVTGTWLRASGYAVEAAHDAYRVLLRATVAPGGQAQPVDTIASLDAARRAASAALYAFLACGPDEARAMEREARRESQIAFDVDLDTLDPPVETTLAVAAFAAFAAGTIPPVEAARAKAVRAARDAACYARLVARRAYRLDGASPGGGAEAWLYARRAAAGALFACTAAQTALDAHDAEQAEAALADARLARDGARSLYRLARRRG